MPDLDDDLEMPVSFGVYADTGERLQGMDSATLTAFGASGGSEPLDPSDLESKDSSGEAHYGTVGEVDAKNLDEAGWAVLYGPSVDQKIKDALKPLIDHRRAQVGSDELCREFEADEGFFPGDTCKQWLLRPPRRVRIDVVDPANGVPFYIMIVASPEEIPFEFQYALDLYWGVGRLWFDTPDEFRQYAESVIRYENMVPAAIPTKRQAALFATCHELDNATQRFYAQVAQPMAEGAPPHKPLGKVQKFKLRPFLGDDAMRNDLQNIFCGAIEGGQPALLFTGGHGQCFKPQDPRLEACMGALLCQDWPGFGGAKREHYFDGSDLPANAKVHGMMHFLFACYGAGWPQHDNYMRMEKEPAQIAPRPAIARLPQKLLSHPDGGALAVFGHVERAWGYSFRSEKGGAQAQGFRDVMGRLMRGERIGMATDAFNMRWAALSTELAESLNLLQLDLPTPPVSPEKLANQWVARDDARNYIVFGDPAVRLRQEDMPELA